MTNDGSNTYAYDAENRMKTGSTATYTYDGRVPHLRVLCAGGCRISRGRPRRSMLGRGKQQQLTSDPEGITYTDNTFDGDGMTASGSNPYRSTSDPTYGLTHFVYDALGRVTTTTRPDSNISSASYSGSCVTRTDEAGKQHLVCVDGLGRTVSAFEPAANGQLTLETDYAYDALGNKAGGPLSISSNWVPHPERSEGWESTLHRGGWFACAQRNQSGCPICAFFAQVGGGPESLPSHRSSPSITVPKKHLPLHRLLYPRLLIFI